ncbi:hypothetical protein [Bradyrhizobium sp. CCBAU 51745]|uniref:hypothetical protein n=1 Tax=Bradyrhizobium sp. CCBAU 51745 TaxID=1325099 RepID=UPI002305D80B|nr:hypothetical protein [Bradyrhizobium sp. CCBAU 51745]
MIRSDINGVMWSMTVECFASPLILASFLAYKRYGARPLFVLCAVLFSLSWWGAYVHLLGGVTNLAPLYAFVVGVLLHLRRGRSGCGNSSSAAQLLLSCLFSSAASGSRQR